MLTDQDKLCSFAGPAKRQSTYRHMHDANYIAKVLILLSSIPQHSFLCSTLSCEGNQSYGAMNKGTSYAAQ